MIAEIDNEEKVVKAETIHNQLTDGLLIVRRRYEKLRKLILEGKEAFPFDLAEKHDDNVIPTYEYDEWVDNHE